MIRLFAMLLIAVSAFVAGCATDDWNSGGSERSSGYHGGHHH